MFRLVHADAPSLVSHWMPDGHQMTNVCWCKPFLQHQDRGESTVVMHHEEPADGAKAFPFASQMPLVDWPKY